MAELKIQVGKANQLVIRASGSDISVDNEAAKWLKKNWQKRDKEPEPLVVLGVFLSSDEVSLTFMTKKDRDCLEDSSNIYPAKREKHETPKKTETENSQKPTITIWLNDSLHADELAKSLEEKGYRLERILTSASAPTARVGGGCFSQGYGEIRRSFL